MTIAHARYAAAGLAWLFATAIGSASAEGTGTLAVMPVLAEDVALRAERPGVVRAARLAMDTPITLRDADTVSIEVFGRMVAIERDRFSARDGGWTWEGEIDGGEGWAVIAQQDGRIAGYLQIARYGNAVEIVPLADGGSALMERDERLLPETGQPLAPDVDNTVPHGALAPQEDPYALRGDITWVDALVMYTAAASTRAGGHAAVSARAHVDVAWLNRALRNNGVAMAYRLLAVKPLALVEPVDNEWGTFLRAFRDDPAAQALRNEYGADMMGLYVHRDANPDCGRGYVMRSLGAGFASWSYQYSHISCGVRVYAHESGHTMGLEHDPDNSGVGATPEDASRPWSFGHGLADGANSFRTIMAYASVCGGNPCTQVIAFSAPDRTANGHPIGIDGQRHTARTLDEDSRAIVSAFRTSVMIFQSGFD